MVGSHGGRSREHTLATLYSIDHPDSSRPAKNLSQTRSYQSGAPDASGWSSASSPRVSQRNNEAQLAIVLNLYPHDQALAVWLKALAVWLHKFGVALKMISLSL